MVNALHMKNSVTRFVGFLATMGLFLASAAPTLAFTDSNPPVVSAVSPTAAAQGASVTFSATYADQEATSGEALPACVLYEGGSNLGTMTITGTRGAGTASLAYAFATVGTHNLQVVCTDSAFNTGSGPITPVTVTAAPPPDTTPPAVGAISPTTAVAGASATYSATYSDGGSGVTQCQLSDGGIIIWISGMFGPFANGTASIGESFTAGTHNLQMQCRDGAGLWGYGAVTPVTVSSAADTTPPTVGAVSPVTATVGVNTTFSASYGDNVGVTRCLLYVNGVDSGNASLGAPTGGTASRIHQFAAAGTFNVYFTCWDAAGYATPGTARGVTVSAGTGTTASPGNLMKLPCPAGAGVNDPCKAVYYYGSDGRRHAFPNERTYFTWYANFDAVVTVNGAFMASIPLGSNVTYHPGVRMVKFTTVNTVYAVARRGLLRPIASEAVAAALYGANWNRQIDDISDAFYANYTYGASINNASDFNPSAESAAVTTIDANL